jgi:hypothetical protein
MSKGESDSEFAKASIKKDTKKILRRIVAEEDTFEYELIEKLLREKYPKYFRGQGMMI